MMIRAPQCRASRPLTAPLDIDTGPSGPLPSPEKKRWGHIYDTSYRGLPRVMPHRHADDDWLYKSSRQSHGFIEEATMLYAMARRKSFSPPILQKVIAFHRWFTFSIDFSSFVISRHLPHASFQSDFRSCRYWWLLTRFHNLHFLGLWYRKFVNYHRTLLRKIAAWFSTDIHWF